MSIEPKEAAIAMAIQLHVGHPPPYTREQCEAIDGTLLVHGAADLSELTLCPNVTGLDLFACAGDLSVIASLPRLRKLRACATAIGGLGAVMARPELEVLEVLYCDVTDLAPLVGHPGVRRGILIGLPLDEASWNTLRPRLQTAPLPGTDRPAVWLFSSPHDRELTCNLFREGLSLCFAMFDGRLPLLVRPGVPHSRRIGVDYVMARPEVIHKVRAEVGDVDARGLLTAVAREVYGRSPRPGFNFRSQREIGDATDALDWIANARNVPDPHKAVLADFVHRFRGLSFFREETGLSGLEERRFKVKLPVWLVNYRVTVAGVAPHLLEPQVAYHVGAFEHPVPAFDADVWLSFGLAGLYAAAHEAVLAAGWFCIGSTVGGPPLALVVRVQGDGPDDPAIYAYDPDDLGPGHQMLAPPVPVFGSWLSMLRRVDAVKMAADVVEARR